MKKAKRTFRLSFLMLMSVLLFLGNHAYADKLKVGVPTALTGEAAPFGMDIKNALTLMNERFGKAKYELIFEDERCENRAAVSVAHKLINIDKVKYALGFPCNGTMLTTASIYDRAGVLVLTSAATSGDVLDVGKSIFRLFPSDVAGATLLFDYMAKRHKKIAILTEQNEYSVMMARTIDKVNSSRNKPLDIISEEFVHGGTDLRTVLSKLISKGVEAIFVNAGTDNSFIPVVKQIKDMKFKGTLYSAYLPASAVVRKALGEEVNGFIFANLPVSDELVTEKGKEVLAEFRGRYGEPQSGFPVVPISFEAFRIFDLAISSGKPPLEFLKTTKFSGGFIPDFYFDEYGSVQGINFQMQKIENGKVIVLRD